MLDGIGLKHPGRDQPYMNQQSQHREYMLQNKKETHGTYPWDDHRANREVEYIYFVFLLV
jgi:hypothetical protein